MFWAWRALFSTGSQQGCTLLRDLNEGIWVDCLRQLNPKVYSFGQQRQQHRGAETVREPPTAAMGLLHNQNLTLGFSQPDVTYWESTPQPSLAVNNTIIVLAVLTFALQLCLVLFFMLRCWRLDNRVREALKHPDADNKLTALRLFHPDIYKQPHYQLCNEAAGASSPATSAAVEIYEATTDSVCAPSIPWDLVQRW